MVSEPRTESMFVELQDMEQGDNPTLNASLTNGLDSSASNHYPLITSTPSCSPPESTATQYTWMPDPASNIGDLNGHPSPESLPSSPPRWEEAITVTSNGETIYKCDACTFSTLDKLEYDSHTGTHVDHKCSYCDYTSRAEGRLKRHIREFHSDVEPNAVNWVDKDIDGEKTPLNGQPNKKKRYKCRQCPIYLDNKTELWKHTRTHIKTDKLLSCPDCPFVTEYKHHMEYHLLNHAGAKPFKCSKCDYTCVNKSMLNSHLKSHSSFVPYQCSSCQYGTKYIHSLRLHLKKYNHSAAVRLKSDGTGKIHTTIDAFGARKGPRTKKSKEKSPPRVETIDGDVTSSINSQDNMAVGQNLFYSYPPHQLRLPVVSHSTTHNGYTSPVVFNSTNLLKQANPINDPVLSKPSTSYMQCNLCGYPCGSKDIYNTHLLTHAAKDNEDLFRLFGINTESFSVADLSAHVQTTYPYYQYYVKNGYPHDYSGKPSTPPVNGNVTISPGQNSNPPTIEVPTEEEEEVTNTSSNNATNSELAPLDLSNGKSSPKHPKVEIPATQELSRNRRKGKAFKLGRRLVEEEEEDQEDGVSEDQKALVPSFEVHKSNGLCMNDTRIVSIEPSDATTNQQQSYHCHHCEVIFSDWFMYSIHMGFHGRQDPFQCSLCRKQCNDKRSLFMHIAESAH